MTEISSLTKEEGRNNGLWVPLQISFSAVRADMLKICRRRFEILMDRLPTEILYPILAYVHPNQIGEFARLNRGLRWKTWSIHTDFLFALANLGHFGSDVKWQQHGTELIDVIKAKRTLNFHVLPCSYHAAFLAVNGVTLKAIDHFEIHFNPAAFDFSFVKRGHKMLPAIKLARRHKRLDITSENAMLVAIVASVYADVPLLQETIAIEGFNESKIADLFAWGAAANCMQSVEFFLSWGYSPPAAALIHAAANGHFETVKRLLENAEAWFYASTLSVALIAACEKGSVNVDVVRCLLSVSLTNPGHNKNAALIASVEGGHTELVSLLLETKKCDPSDQDNKCVLLATSKGYEDIIDLLLNTESCKLNISVNDNAPIRVAVSGGYTRMVASLLATRNCDPSAIDNQCIITACTNGFTHIVELLLRHPSVDPRASQCDSLVRAAKGGYFEIVEMLLEWHGPEGEYMDPSAQNNATIVEASKNGHASVVRVLLDCEGVSARVNNNEAFYRACCGGHLEVAELLYFSRDLKLDPAVGLRACEEAAKGAHTSTVSFLLRVVGVPVSSSVLLLASERGHFGIVQLLLDNWAADFHFQTLTRSFALAAANNHVDCVRVFLQVHTQYSFAPALVKAASSGHFRVILAILQSDRKVVIPHDAVMSAKDKGIKDLLKSAMGKRAG